MVNNSPEFRDILNIVNNAFDAIVYYVPIRDNKNEIIDFKFIYMNDSALKILSGTKEKYLGHTFLELFPYAVKDGMYEAFKKTAETGIPSEDTYYYEYGEYRGWYRDSIIKYREGIVVYFRDVTGQKLLELELKNKSEELQKLLKEKEILLRETHHRIKNNLQLIASMLNLQGQNINDPYFLEILNTCKERIFNIARIHQRFYEDKSFSSINLKLLIDEISKSLNDAHEKEKRNIRFIHEISEIKLDLNETVYVGLIINELLTNCFKYAFKGRSDGEIKVIINEKDDNFHIIISDNGIGMPKDFNLDKLETLGLSLVYSLVEQMNGTFEITSSNGTTCLVTFPVANRY